MRISKPSHTIVAVAAIVSVWAGPRASLSAQGSRDRTLFVSAVDAAGKPVEGLGPDAFVIREDGTRREVLRVSRATEPIDIVLLVDNSTAAAEEIMFLRTALAAFVKKMAPGNFIAVVTLAERPTIRTNYTSDPVVLGDSVSSLFSMPQSGMTLLDAVTEVSRGLARRETPRAVVVPVVTDGTEFTTTYHQDAVKALVKAKAALHAVTLGLFNYSDDHPIRERAFFLEAGPAATGGQRITLLSPNGLGQALDRLAAELSSQYKVVYARPQSLIAPEKVSVSSARPNLVVRGAPARGESGE
jgi:VWFA-related protein